MSDIRITAGSWEAGDGTYEAGLLRLPNGEVRGLEECVELSIQNCSETGARRRAGIVGGLRSALSAAGPLPQPLDLAASFVGLGLGALGGDLHALLSVTARFGDGAHAAIVTDPATAAAMMRDREVIHLALLRRSALHRAEVPALPAPEAEREADRALTSIFEYEKRKGRLRRLAVAKAPDET